MFDRGVAKVCRATPANVLAPQCGLRFFIVETIASGNSLVKIHIDTVSKVAADR